jgi:hypothetical protein
MHHNVAAAYVKGMWQPGANSTKNIVLKKTILALNFLALIIASPQFRL